MVKLNKLINAIAKTRSSNLHLLMRNVGLPVSYFRLPNAIKNILQFTKASVIKDVKYYHYPQSFYGLGKCEHGSFRYSHLKRGGTNFQLHRSYVESIEEEFCKNPIHYNMDSKMSFIRSVNDYSISAYQDFNLVEHTDSPSVIELFCYRSINRSISNEIIEKFLNLIATNNWEIVTDKQLSTMEYETDWSIDSEASMQQRVITLKIDDVVVCIELIFTNSDCVVIYVSNHKNDIILNFFTNDMKEFKKHEEIKDNTFYTISSGSYGFELTSMTIKKIDNEYITFLDNYNDDFFDADKVIKDSIEEGKRGLMLLHGIPGSGKTSYIKHLITYGPKRKIVYVPTHLASAIANPEFMGFVKDNLTNAVLVIEDAEQVLLSREDGESHKAAVSNLLNMTDGILADALNILIIATFNTDTSNIDQALLRKGRLLLSYKFDKLSKEKTNALTMKLFAKPSTEEMTLAEIYNLDYELIKPEEKEKQRIGFY